MSEFRAISFVLILTSAILARGVWSDYLEGSEVVFVHEAGFAIVDVAVDSTGRFVVLGEVGDSFAVEVISPGGTVERRHTGFMGGTPQPRAIHLELSGDGGIIVVWGLDTELKTPINWVLDESGADILPYDNLLKYAEWIQVSPSGKFFTCQGFDDFSVIPHIYSREWEEIEWPFREMVHGYFIGRSDGGGDLLLATEWDLSGNFLTLTDLPSMERIFESDINFSNGVLSAHRMRSIGGDGYIIMNYPIQSGGTIYCFDKSTGKIRWTVDPVDIIAQMGISFDGTAPILTGYYCVQIIDSSGFELGGRCENKDLMKMPLYQPGVPDISFWRERGIFFVAMYLPGYTFPTRTVIARLDDDGIADPEMFFMRFEGFRIGAEDLLSTIREKVLTIYRLPPK